MKGAYHMNKTEEMSRAEQIITARTDPFDKIAVTRWQQAWAALNPNYDPEEREDAEKYQAAWLKATGLPDMSQYGTTDEMQEALTEYFKERTDSLGAYARIRRDYLMYYDEEQYWMLIQSMGEFYKYLTEIERESREKVSLLTDQLAEADEEMTEELKRREPLKWVGLMGNAAARAREIVIHELSQ
jgi:hypothetical protein